MISHRPILLGNPMAGLPRSRRRFPLLEKTFLARFPQGRILLSSPSSTDLLEADLLVVYGGDGTLARLLALPLPPDLPLLLLPGGTGNVLSRSLNVPFDPGRPGEIFRRLGGARPLFFSPGMAGRVRFCLMAGAGWDGVAARKVWGKERLGALSYYLAGISATFSRHLPWIDVKILGEEGEEIVREDNIWVLVSRLPPYFGLFRVPGAGKAGGTPLMVTLVRRSGLRIPGAFLEMFPGVPPGFFSERIPAREVVLFPNRPTIPEDLPCQADGEVIPPFSRIALSGESLTFLQFGERV